MTDVARLQAELSQLRVELRRISTQQIRSDIDTLEALHDTPAYLFGGTVYFPASGTFSKADYPGLKAVKARVQGSGGGGGGAGTTTSGQVSIGQTGAGGAYAEKLILAADLSASETVTVGAGGAGASAGGNGSAGNSSSFGSHCSAAGGAAGGRTGPTAPVAMVAGKSPTTTGTGDLVIPGGGSESVKLIFANVAAQSFGGAAHLGAAGGVGVSATGSNGGNGVAYGSGGTGGVNAQSQGTARSGGAGADGIVVVELYF